MARLEKSFQDYFKIPVLLQPIGDTQSQSLGKIYEGLTSEPFQLTIDERYDIPDKPYCQVLQSRPKGISQTIDFRLEQFKNQWSQFEVIYRCRFVIGVFNPIETTNLPEQWAKINKRIYEDKRKPVGLIILSTEHYEMTGIQIPFIIIPSKLPINEMLAFLEPWFYLILGSIEESLCFLIKELSVEDNDFVVFNKREDKSEPKILKKKRKGRCFKLCGDFCLTLHLITQAYNFYVTADQILKKIDDYLWQLGCNQGKLACFTTQHLPSDLNKFQETEEARIQCFSLAKKIRISELEIENAFKIFKIYTGIPRKFDELAMDFIGTLSFTHNSSERFLIYVQLAQLYLQAGMPRKRNYFLYLSGLLVFELKPHLANLLFNQILKSGKIDQWPMLQSHIIKLLIDNGHSNNQSKLHLNLLQNCSSVLSNKDIDLTIENLTYRNFEVLKMNESKMFKVVGISCLESDTKPKPNKISEEGSSKGNSQGFFMNWRKKQVIYYFQQNQLALFEVRIKNYMKFSIKCAVSLNFEHQAAEAKSFILEPGINKLSIPKQFHFYDSPFVLKSIEIQFYSFCYLCDASQLSPIKIEIYEEYPMLSINMPQIINNQQSSLFELPISISRDKPYLKLAKILLTISIYYLVEVGFQESQFCLDDIQSNQLLVTTQQYPYDTVKKVGQKLLKIKPFKVDKKYLKKIEVKVDVIRHINSKFQVSKTVSSECRFHRSIWCELKSVSTPIQQQFNRKNERIIQEDFIIRITVHKQDNNLIPYQIILDQKKYSLSEETCVTVEKRIRKLNPENRAENLKIELKWVNLARQEEYGNIVFQTPVEQKMMLSDKIVDFFVHGEENSPRKTVFSGATTMNVGYLICPKEQKCDLSHSFVVQPLNISHLKKYTLQGKTRIVDKFHDEITRKIKNEVQIKIFYQYKQSYMVGIKFDNGQIFWHPCIYEIVP